MKRSYVMGIFVALAIFSVAIGTAMAGQPLKSVGLQGTGNVSDWGVNGLLVTSYVNQDWYHIYQVDATTGSRTHVCSGANATYDPSGNKFAYWEAIGDGFSLSIFNLQSATSIKTGVVTQDFQSRISWGSDNKIRFTWSEGYPYISSLGTYWEEGTSRYWTKGLAGGPYDVMDPKMTPQGVLFGRKDVGIQRSNFDGTITTVATQPDPMLPIRYASVWNNKVLCADVQHIYLDGVQLFNGTQPVLDPSGQMIVHTAPSGWIIDAMPSSTVPEPGSIVAMFSGLVGMIGYGIRRKK